jgi:hypothetical protein
LDFDFIAPWTPQRSPRVERLKTWEVEDQRDRSLQRDLEATLKVGELFGMTTPGADELRGMFTDLADVGYAGYCYFDFPGMSLESMLKVYEDTSRSYVGRPDFKALYRWYWLDELFDNSGSVDGGRAKIILKNASQPDEALFGRLQQADTKFGAPADKTQDYFLRSVAAEYARYHPGHQVFTPEFRELTILALMDLVDPSTEPGGSGLPRRFTCARGYRDMAGGRLFPRGMYGRIWVNYDTSIAFEADPGMDHPRTGFTLAAVANHVQHEAL